jgi:hypothetical protein
MLQIQQVASYIISLKGTNPPKQKAPQGIKVEDAGAKTPAPNALPDTTTARDSTTGTATMEHKVAMK